MNNKLYFTTEIGKVYFEIDNCDYQFYKVVDLKLLRLNNKEKKAINDRLTTNNLIVFDKIIDTLKENHQLTTTMITGSIDDISLDTIFTKDILDSIVNQIPEENRDIFYNNLKNLNIQFVSPSSIENSLTGDYKKQGNFFASYLIDKNTIFFSKIIVDFLKQKAISNNIQDVNLFIKNNMQKLLIHELLHMASSEYNPATVVFYSGLIEANGKDKTKAYNNNLGLTEGFTEALTTTIMGDNKTLEQYDIEHIITLELINIFGMKTMKKVYFKDHNINRLIQGLCDIDSKTFSDIEISKRNATNLFKMIEFNFAYNNIGKQNILANIQKRIAAYFIQNIDIDIKNVNNMSEGTEKERYEQEINRRCSSFEEVFNLTRNLDQNKYEGLDDAYRFYKDYSVLFNIDRKRGNKHEI